MPANFTGEKSSAVGLASRHVAKAKNRIYDKRSKHVAKAKNILSGKRGWKTLGSPVLSNGNNKATMPASHHPPIKVAQSPPKPTVAVDVVAPCIHTTPDGDYVLGEIVVGRHDRLNIDFDI